MTVIPKEEVQKQESARREILRTKQEFVNLLETVQETSPNFNGTPEEISTMKEGELKSQFTSTIAKLESVENWHSDCLRMLKMKKQKPGKDKIGK